MRSLSAMLAPSLLLLSSGCRGTVDLTDDDTGLGGLSDPLLDIEAALLDASVEPTMIPEDYPTLHVTVELEMTNDWHSEVEQVAIAEAALVATSDSTPIADLALSVEGDWDGIVPSGTTETHTYGSHQELMELPEGGLPCSQDVHALMRVTFSGGQVEDLASTSIVLGCDTGG